jgi:hypothetical protein
MSWMLQFFIKLIKLRIGWLGKINVHIFMDGESIWSYY